MTESPNPFIERRMTMRLLRYWERIKGDRLFPSENDIDPDDPDIVDVWDGCFVIQVRDIFNHQDYNYTYLGPAIIQAYKAGISNDSEQPIVSPNANKLQQHFHKVLETRAPIMQDGEFRNLKNTTIKYRQCLLPLGHGNTIDAIFGGMSFKLMS